MSDVKIATGNTIDGFLVGKRIHAGGMASLWEVTRPDIDFPILMKVPKLGEGEDPATIVSFEMEQMILARIAGPHVPRFVASGDLGPQPFIVMERIQGNSLLPLLEKLPLPLEQVIEIGTQVGIALDDLHNQHVVHLDIKPSNIMMRPNGEAVLIDFGLSRHDQLPDLMEEEFRLPYGTAPYMSPEQVLGNRREPRSDLFALGVLLYFFATGERPFGDPQRLSGLKQRIWRDPQPPRALRPDLPPWFQEIVMRCLEVNPAWRYPTAAQVVFDLSHPSSVRLTARSEKLERDGFLTTLKRRFNPEMAHRMKAEALAKHINDGPIVVVAIDLDETSEQMTAALIAAVRNALRAIPKARLACLNVLKQSHISLESTNDEDGTNKHLKRLVALRHWAEPLKLGEGNITFHVLEALKPAEAILDFVEKNRVDHVIMGARANSRMRSLLGSVSGVVAANALCSVTVVRRREKIKADAEVSASA